MADTKISALTAATALDGTEVVAGVQSSATVKITGDQLAALVPSAFAYSATVTLNTTTHLNWAMSDDLTGNLAITLSNGAAGRRGTVAVRQDGTGSRTVSFTATGATMVNLGGAVAPAADAFSYIVFLRLVPTPSWVTNLMAAVFEVRLRTFIAATVVGRTPGSFTFAFLGVGLGSVIDAQQAAYRACLAAGGDDCRIDFDPANVLTPTLLAALIALGLLALLPVVAKRLRWRRAQSARM